MGDLHGAKKKLGRELRLKEQKRCGEIKVGRIGGGSCEVDSGRAKPPSSTTHKTDEKRRPVLLQIGLTELLAAGSMAAQ